VLNISWSSNLCIFLDSPIWTSMDSDSSLSQPKGGSRRTAMCVSPSCVHVLRAASRVEPPFDLLNSIFQSTSYFFTVTFSILHKLTFIKNPNFYIIVGDCSVVCADIWNFYRYFLFIPTSEERLFVVGYTIGKLLTNNWKLFFSLMRFNLCVKRLL